MLKALAIVLGLLITITRGFGVLFPGEFKRLALELASRETLVRVMGIALLIFAILIFFALGNNWTGVRVVMGVFGIISLVGGVFLMFLPAQYAALIEWLMEFPDQDIRILAGIAVVMGALVLILGIVYY